MKLEGSCHCGKVRFSVESKAPVPYQRCYCSICRKTGGGGFMVNISGVASTLQVEGADFLGDYRATLQRDGQMVTSGHRRRFCKECGSHVYAHHDDWPDLVHPVASAVDTPLPKPPSHTHIFLASRPAWVEPDIRDGDKRHDVHPDASLEAWHREHDLWEE